MASEARGEPLHDFLRASTPAQKQERRDAILAAAGQQIGEHGLRAVTLSRLAGEVGLNKSNVVRYFGTREEIFVELTVRRGETVTKALLAGLQAIGRSPTVEQVAALFVDTVSDDGLFCELMSQLSPHLEHNVSYETAERVKLAMADQAERLSNGFAHSLPELNEAQALAFVAGATLIVTGLWQAAHPSEVVRQVGAARPEVARMRETAPSLAMAAVTALLRGSVRSDPTGR